MSSAASQFEEDNRNMKLMLESRIVREKAMRQAQIAEKEQRRNDEKQLRLNLEHIEIAQIRKLTQDDEEKRRIRRENERKALVAVKAEDVRNRSIRLEELSNQREFESKICRDYE